MLNVNLEKIHSLILCVTCHGLRNFPCPYTSPQNHLWIFKTLWVIIFWVRVTHKMLNVNCMKIHSLILCVTCHGLRNFASAHTHPPKTIHEFSKPYELLFSELESLVKLYKNLLNNFICHLSWLQKLSPSDRHPLISIREFWNPELLYFELESLVKCNHKIRVQECYRGRAMSCPWHGGGRHMGGPFR